MAVEVSRMPMNFPNQGSKPSDVFIKNLERSLIERYRPRNQDYQVLVNAWHGVYYDNADTRYDMDTLGRPMLRVQDSRMENVPETLNVLKGFADAYKRMLVYLPDIRVPRPPGRFSMDLAGQQQSEQYQARMKRVGYGIWDASQLQIQEVAAAFWLSTCGSVGICVVPDFDRGHAVIQYVAPWDIYGIGKVGDDYSLSRVIISSDQDISAVQSTYGEQIAKGGTYMSERDFLTAASTMSEPTRKESTMRHTVYMDEHWFVRMMGSKVIGEAKHDLGFCPAMISPFILLPQYVNRGASPIEQLLPMQLSINFAVTLWEEGFKDSVLPTTWVRNAAQIPANFARGRGQLISIGENGDIGELGGRSAEAMRTVESHVDMMIRFMELNSGVSRPQLEGRLASGGPTSGRGLEKASGPYLAGVEEIQNTQAFFKGKALKMAFDMTASEDIPWKEKDEGTPDKVCFSGTFKDEPFYEEFAREELKGIPTPDMSYSPMAHLGMHERLVMVLQQLGSVPPLISWDAAVDMVGIVRDHPNMRAEIESDLRWRLQIMQSEVAIQSGQGLPQPDAMAAGASAAAGATNPATVARSGIQPTPAAPIAPNVTTPGGGGPAMPVQSSAGTMGAPATASATLPADVVSKMGAVPEPPPAEAAPTGRQSEADQVRGELAVIRTNGDVLLVGNTIYVDWNDKAVVAKTIGHHSGFQVRVKSKNDANVPADAQVIATGTGRRKKGAAH